jgi:hypothetical protein
VFLLEFDKIAAVTGEDATKLFQIEFLATATRAHPARLSDF